MSLKRNIVKYFAQMFSLGALMERRRRILTSKLGRLRKFSLLRSCSLASPIYSLHPTSTVLLSRLCEYRICNKADESRQAIAKIEACVSEIDLWMLCNKLKLNRGKTELLILSARHRPLPSINLEYVDVSGERIEPSPSARSYLR